MKKTSCKQCGKPFTPKTYNQEYCGEKCKWKFHNNERLAALKLVKGGQVQPKGEWF